MGKRGKPRKYDREEVKESALKLIKEDEKIVFFNDVCMVLGLPQSTFSEMFPAGSDEKVELEDAIENNKIKMKMKIRDRLMECKNPGAYIFLYKILTSNIEERKMMDARYPEDHIEENKVINLKIK